MRVLYLHKRPVLPADAGNKIRSAHILSYLAKRHDVTFVCNVLPHESESLRLVAALGVKTIGIPWKETSRQSARFAFELAANLFSRFPYSVAKDYSRELKSRLTDLLQTERFDVLICDFAQMALNVEGINAPRKILFTHNVEAEVTYRTAQTFSGPGRTYMMYQYRKMKQFEQGLGDKFDQIIAVSERDKRHFEEAYSWRNVGLIGTSVDTNYFRPSPKSASVTDPIVLFLGTLNWLPNIDGLKYFLSTIWHRILEQQPSTQFHIVGRSPSPQVVQLARNARQTHLYASPQDVRPYLANADVVVVPLRAGGGTRLKIFEAMAMQRPVVSTSLGAEGLPIEHGQHLLVADSPEEFANHVVQLLRDNPKAKILSDAARQLVLQKHGVEVIGEQFEKICCDGGKASQAATLTQSA